MINNRNKIERFCKKHDIVINSLEYMRNRDAEYGHTWDASYWYLECTINGRKEEFDSYDGEGVNKDVDRMLKLIKEVNDILEE